MKIIHKNNLVWLRGTTDSVDFVLAQGNLTQAQQEQVPDAQTIPLFSYGVAPAYNVPELIPVGQMNYTWEIMAGILLGKMRCIFFWNSERNMNETC